MISTKNTGDKGELLAIEYLQRKGYHIQDTNFKFGRFWEIDVIAKKDQTTIFIEVKYRASDAYGLPEESITRGKLQKLKKTIEYYCVTHGISLEKIQFDVITILKGNTWYRLTHYKNQSIS